jgi:hypothetical protein
MRITRYGLKYLEQRGDDLLTVSDGFTDRGFRKVAFVPFELREEGLDVHGIPDKPSTGAKTCAASVHNLRHFRIRGWQASFGTIQLETKKVLDRLNV